MPGQDKRKSWDTIPTKVNQNVGISKFQETVTNNSQGTTGHAQERGSSSGHSEEDYQRPPEDP